MGTDDTGQSGEDDRPARSRRSNNDAVVAFGSDAVLAAGRAADAVVAIGGNASSAGDVRDGVVAVGGNASATGPVGDAVVAILGDAYLNSSARSVVAIMGNVQLGPEARVSREVVAVGGSIDRDPAAVVSREQAVAVARFGHLEGLRTWIRRCALMGRPLALDRNLDWAWGIALGFLALYALMALLFRDPMQRCIDTLETQPGRSALAGLVSIFLVPVVTVLLVMTVIGIVVVPFFATAVTLAALFGKAVTLAWIGRRIYRDERPVIPLLIGGAIVLALYLVPVLGFVVYKLLGFLGLGVVAYTLFLALWPRRPAPGTPAGVTASAAATDVAPVVSAAPAPAPAFAEATVHSGAPESSPGAGPPAAAAAVATTATLEFTSLPRAGFWARMGALFLDGLLILLVTNLVADPGPRSVLALLALYAAVMWQLKGTTIGGSILGLKLVRTDGRAIDWPTAVARALGCLLSLAVAGLGFLWIVFDDERQAWHDKIAGTAVVKVPKGVPLL